MPDTAKYLDFPQTHWEIVPQSQVSETPKLIALVDNAEITINKTDSGQTKMQFKRGSVIKWEKENKRMTWEPNDVVSIRNLP